MAVSVSAVASVSNKLAVSHAAEAEPTIEAKVCEYTLRKVFSWLEVPELVCSAALVSQRWAAAAGCKEVWRRRMHKQILETLFNNNQQQLTVEQQHKQNKTQHQLKQDTCTADADQQQQQQQQQQEQGSAKAGAEEENEQPQQQKDPTAAAIAALSTAGVTPAKLFAAVYGTNLLVNGSFLERLNHGLNVGSAGRRLVWEPTFNARGMTWAHPFDFFPELCPLPEDQGSGAAPAKPFSVGCLATASGAWSEVVQVVDLQSVLVAQGLPAATAAWVIAAGGLPLELSVMVAGGAAAGGEYQVVLALISAADVATAAASDIPLSAVPKLSLPFDHPPSGCPGIDVVAAGQLKARGLGQGSKVLARAPLHPAPGIWSRFTCRTVLPRDTPISHVVIGLRGRASRNSRLGHYATKFADARLKFVTADQS